MQLPSYIYLRQWHGQCQHNSNGLFQKKKKKTGRDAGVEGFPLDFLGFFIFIPGNYRQNKASSLETLQNCVTPLRNFKAPRNRTTLFFLDQPWKVHGPCRF